VRKIIQATVRHSRLTTELIEEEHRVHEAKMAAMHASHEATMAASLREYEEARQAPVSLDFSSLTVEDLYDGPLSPHLR
jgi:hypothetical protein